MNENLKKGQMFIGFDNNKYYFLGYSNDNQIFFTNEELWSEKKYLIRDTFFVKKVTDKFSDLIKRCTWYYQSKNELDRTPIYFKLRRCLDNISNSNNSEVELRPTKIGPLVRGQAYYKNLDQYYEVIGFLIECNIYVDKEINCRNVGMFSIYHSTCDEQAPLIFEIPFDDNSWDGKTFINGYDDKVIIQEILLSKAEIDKEIDYKNIKLDRVVSLEMPEEERCG
ncbi:MAG TPA: hypothetical protein PLT65_00755 [Bacilli bacterium]|nr:hypothetical protein [Bacilli bacterium]